ncbi:hypothetical protein HETIRDRAFT_321418 [Heterobasidion irregulare TC 32-1]|uniref:Uncharacterized protein n=1 Tax=Heterobasidion irregulare (strain TC 32-1) TaxID=747525 RepID=W4K1B5_HETIT|nr:uncharacterized protein HETIRDRAFT_321418 [Heterobasidion irregulare TC 32-1]ETW79623.1 hypothetical protein HETIRDRAFT_321418 [Heterobasidion irregulare TC 32-1]
MGVGGGGLETKSIMSLWTVAHALRPLRLGPSWKYASTLSSFPKTLSLIQRCFCLR